MLRTSGCDLTAAGVEWKVNGKTAEAQKGYTFSAAETKKGDTIQASAMTRTGEVLSNTVVTRNLPPEIVDAYVKPGTAGVSVEAEASDADNDPIALSYEWTKNGKPAGNGKSLETTFAKGEKVSVKITPFDGEAYGKPVVLNSEINNAPLVITQDKEFNFDGRRWTYQIKASGGDTLTYALNSAPPGMTINPNTGLIAWNVPDGFSGQTAFTVTVSDGHGGEASYTAKINIK
ncbi:MAG: putative Ig domain-containing protein [Acidobacteriota bacterium]